jgi:hypothetical protein
VEVVRAPFLALVGVSFFAAAKLRRGLGVGEEETFGVSGDANSVAEGGDEAGDGAGVGGTSTETSLPLLSVRDAVPFPLREALVPICFRGVTGAWGSDNALVR